MSDTFQAIIPSLPASDLAKGAAFYVDHLGFDLVHLDASVAVLVRDGLELHLWPAQDDSWQGREGPPVQSGAESFIAGTASCRIRLDGLEALHASCLPAGIVHSNGPIEAKPWGYTEFSVLDPDGNLVTFFRPSGSP